MKFKTQPYKHQLECLKKFGRTPAFALLAEMGTGKTWIIINDMAGLWTENKCDGVLVFAPNGVHSNWTRLEIPKHMPDDVSYICVAWSANPKVYERIFLTAILNPFPIPVLNKLNKKITSFIDQTIIFSKAIGKSDCPIPMLKPDLRILTMNWEALQNKKGMDVAYQFAKSCKQLMIVCDESDSIKNPRAKRTQNLMFLKRFAKWKRIMTGTSINNSPFDAFSQFNFLDEDILGTTSFYAFKAQYAEMLHPSNTLVKSIRARASLRGVPQIVARGIGNRPKYKNLDKLSKLIAPHSFRVLKEDCLDLPEKIYKTLLFDLTPQQKAIYKKAKVECRLVFENEETPFTKLVAITKLAQITSGYYIHPLSDEPIRIEGKTPKLDLLIERVTKIVEAGGKVIIWARYRIEIADIVARLKEAEISGVQYHGGIKKKAREEAIDEFENGETQVFVGNPQAGGMGITLVGASYVIYFSNDFSYRKRAQSEDRSHRIGQKKNVTYINIAAKHTIDELVIDALLNKKDIADTIIDRGMELFT